MKLKLIRPRIASVLLAGKDTEAPTRILLLREGDIGWQNMEGVVLDAEQAAQIIKEFRSNGVDLPIDWEHTTTASTDADPKPAPAVGWIKELVYVPDQGLYADKIEWVDKVAVEAIMARQYKYYSPVVLINPKTKKITAIHSVALTNKPRTKNCRELLGAAKVRLEAAGVDVMFGDENENADEKQAELAMLLRTLGADLKVDATLSDILDAALDMLSVGDSTPDEENKESDMDKDKDKDKDKDRKDESKASTSTPDVMELAKITSELGSAAKDLGELKKEFAELQVKAARHDELQKRVEALETERMNAKVQALIGEQIESGKLNPHDEKAMAAARKLAASDADAFTALYAGMTVIMPQGKDVGPKDTGVRKQTISAAVREFHSNAAIGRLTSCPGYVNGKLRDAQMGSLTVDERKTLDASA